MSLQATMRALADPIRREILNLLKGGRLSAGDICAHFDVTGAAHYYEVVLSETLPPTATKSMIASGFGLSLYTCTPGGGNRVTVRCDAKSTN